LRDTLKIKYNIYDLKSVHFTTNDSGIIVGYQWNTEFSNGNLSGIILKTNDGGRNWKITADLPYLREIQMVNNNIGYIAGEVILKTEDGGKTWKQVFKQPKVVFNAIHFFDEETGYIAGTACTIYQTKDGGQNWTLLLNSDKIGYDYQLDEIVFADTNKGYALATSGIRFCIQTKDGGKTWKRHLIDSIRHDWSVMYFVDERIGFASGKMSILGGDTTFAYTTNGGDTWKFYEDKFRWAGSKGQASFHFPTKNIGYCIGTLISAIGKTTNGGVPVSRDTKLNNNYTVWISPNPNQGNFIMNLNTNEVGNLKIEIFEITGRLIYTNNILLDDPKVREIPIKLKEIDSGIYSLKVSLGNQTQLVRLIIE